MLQDVGDRACIQTGVDRVEDGASHRYRKMRCQHQRRIGHKQRDDVTALDARTAESGGELSAEACVFVPRLPVAFVDDGDLIWEDARGTLKEADWCKGREVYRSATQARI